ASGDLHASSGDPGLHQPRGEQLELRGDGPRKVFVDDVALHDGGREVQGVCRHGSPELATIFTPGRAGGGTDVTAMRDTDVARPPGARRMRGQTIVRTAAASSSRWSGWAMPVSARARSTSDRNERSTAPCSVTTHCT